MINKLSKMHDNFIVVSEKPLIRIHHAFFPCKNEKYKDRIILIILGWLGNFEGIMPLVQQFQQFASIIVYEPRGHGKSNGPRKRGIYKPKFIIEELAKIIKHYDLKDSQFYLWGSCSGINIGYLYFLEKLGPKPIAFLAASPSAKNDTKWWFMLLRFLPWPLLWLAYKIIFFFLMLYLRIKSPNEMKNLKYSKDKFTKNDLYPLFRFLFEFFFGYDIRGREKELDVPQIIFYGEGDWFIKAEKSMKFVHYHPKSEIVNMGDVHRVYAGKEAKITKYVEDFVNKIESQQ